MQFFLIFFHFLSKYMKNSLIITTFLEHYEKKLKKDTKTIHKKTYRRCQYNGVCYCEPKKKPPFVYR